MVKRACNKRRERNRDGRTNARDETHATAEQFRVVELGEDFFGETTKDARDDDDDDAKDDNSGGNGGGKIS